jgi:hypothetical protein
MDRSGRQENAELSKRPIYNVQTSTIELGEQTCKNLTMNLKGRLPTCATTNPGDTGGKT